MPDGRTQPGDGLPDSDHEKFSDRTSRGAEDVCHARLRPSRTTWLREIFGKGEASTGQNYETLLSDLPQEPAGLFFFPYLAGTGTPWLDAKANGAVLGISTETTQQGFYQACLEGIAYEMLWNIESLKEAGLHFNRIHAVGGGARSDAWLQLKANVFGQEIVAVAGEASCRGAAICAGVGIDTFASWEDGAKALIQERKSFFQISINTGSMVISSVDISCLRTSFTDIVRRQSKERRL